MRPRSLLAAALALVFAACSSSTVNNPPAPLKKELLTGKWKNTSESQILAGYEFAEDGTVKVKVKGMEQPIAGKYSWSGDRALTLDYQAEGDAGQAYKAAAKAYKDDVADRIKSGKLASRAGPGMMDAARDEWPASETLKVAIAEKPLMLMLSNEDGSGMQSFDKVQ